MTEHHYNPTTTMTILNGTTKPLPISQIEGMQTMVPHKVTYPRSSRHILVTNSLDKNLYKQRCHIIMYYNNVHGHDSGWVFAGCAKDSFGRAMDEQPILGGRVRRVEKGKELNGDMEFKVVSNDSGVRLVEARIPIALKEFLDLKEREEAEAQLVFWKDLDEDHPEFCPLLYVQVTNFECGGYSVGISCGLLLADPSTITTFLRKWAKVHTKMASESALKKQLHYLPILKAPNIKNQIVSHPIRNRNKSVSFTTQTNILNHNTDKELVSICIEEAESEFCAKITTETCMTTVTSFEEVVVGKYLRKRIASKFQNKLTRMDSDHFGANEISFVEGTKPICVSNWIYSAPGEVLAILVPSSGESDSLMTIVISIPN